MCVCVCVSCDGECPYELELNWMISPIVKRMASVVTVTMLIRIPPGLSLRRYHF